MEEDAIVRAMRLALLERKEEEQQALHADIENILSFVMSVQSVDTALSEDAPGKKNVFRDDAVTVPAGLYREQMLRQAPNRFKDWFLSKKCCRHEVYRRDSTGSATSTCRRHDNRDCFSFRGA